VKPLIDFADPVRAAIAHGEAAPPALGCRLLALPAGALYELDWRQAHLDNEHIDWKRVNAQYLK